MITLSSLTEITPDTPIVLIPNPPAEDGSDYEGLVWGTVDGSFARSEETAYTEFATAMALPDYFGANANAFTEVMCDLEWLPDGEGFVVLILSPEDFLADSDDDLRLFIDMFNEIAQFWAEASPEDDEWGHDSTPFHIALHGEPGAPWQQRWADAGATLAVLQR